MRGVQLDHVEPGSDRPLGGRHEVLLQLLDLVEADLAGRGVGIAIRDRGGGDDIVWPAAGGDRGGRSVGEPGRDRRRLPAGVRELDADVLALRVGEVGVLLQAADVRVQPDTGVLRGDTAVRLD